MGFMTIWFKLIVNWVWKSVLYFIRENVQIFQTLTFFSRNTMDPLIFQSLLWQQQN